MTEAKEPCPSGKKRHVTRALARTGAHAYARYLNRQGKLASNIYIYRCPQCRGGWHLTRDAAHDGVENDLAYTAPPEELQRWAMGAAR